LALAFAEVVHARSIFIGANVLDYSGYPDCRPEFLHAFETVARLGTKMGVEGGTVEIKAPLLQLTKSQIIQRGVELGVPFELTHSCYDPDESGVACGQCDSCLIRVEGFRQAGLEDPVPYRAR
jgi:7-cyano-7-deazaguanine synthase